MNVDATCGSFNEFAVMVYLKHIQNVYEIYKGTSSAEINRLMTPFIALFGSNDMTDYIGFIASFLYIFCCFENQGKIHLFLNLYHYPMNYDGNIFFFYLFL